MGITMKPNVASLKAVDPERAYLRNEAVRLAQAGDADGFERLYRLARPDACTVCACAWRRILRTPRI